mmetsp:Transcript_20257/g.36137  ORF Transcript_20257/g.36137 Transcript_20257/m.36137 type:complete len:427 (+) Transcript_20257:153-1433(+)
MTESAPQNEQIAVPKEPTVAMALPKDAILQAKAQQNQQVEAQQVEIQTLAAPGNQKEWMSATVTSLDHTKDRARQVQHALRQLEQQEANRLAAQKAERRRQEEQAAAEEKRRKEEIEADRTRRFKEKQAEEYKAQQAAVREAKRAEAAALKDATAGFKKGMEAQSEAKEKDKLMKAMSHTSQQVLSAGLECQHVLSKLWGIMMVCERRQRLRENRPQTERFKDDVDEALEREWQTLTSSRGELSKMVAKGDAIRSDLEAAQVQMQTGQSRENSMRRLMKAGSLPSLGAPQHESKPAKDMIKMSNTLMDEAAELTEQCGRALSKVNSQCDNATTNVCSQLDKRKADLGEIIRDLHTQKVEAEKTIHDGEKRIVRLKRRMEKTMESPRSSQKNRGSTAVGRVAAGGPQSVEAKLGRRPQTQVSGLEDR